MLLENILNEDIKTLEKIIENFPKYNCMDIFLNYLEKYNKIKNNGTIDTIPLTEQKYLKMLNYKLEILCEYIIREKYSNKSKEIIINALVSAYGNISYGFLDEPHEFLKEYSDNIYSDFTHIAIKKYMKYVLDSLLKEQEKTKETKITVIKSNIAHHEKQIELYKKELKELDNTTDDYQYKQPF